MATAGSILQNVRVQIGDPNRDFLSDTIGNEWLDVGQQRFCHEVLALDEIKDYPLTARQKRYDLPTNFIIAKAVLWYKGAGRKLAWTDPSEFETYEVYHPLTTGYPRGYSIIRKQLVVGPASPVANSATVLASGNQASTATTIGFSAASGILRTRGWLENQTTGEVVEFTNVASSTVTGATRGVHGTSPASIASNDQWKEIDMQIRYQKVPALITASTQSPEIPAAFHRYLEQWVKYMAYFSRGDKAKADAAYTQFQEEEKLAKDSLSQRAIEPRGIQDRRKFYNRGYEWGDGM